MDVLSQGHLPGGQVGPQKPRGKRVPRHSSLKRKIIVELLLYTQSKVITVLRSSEKQEPGGDWTCRGLSEGVRVREKRIGKRHHTRCGSDPRGEQRREN